MGNAEGRVAGKVAFITGGSRGIGLAIARAFVAEGVNVAVTGRDERALSRAHAEIDGAGPGRLETLRADVRKYSEVASAIAAVADRFGGLDFVVNKRDMDLNIVLYELMPSGEYFQLSHYLGRASYVRDRSRRHLLVPGKRTRLDISSGRMTSRKLGAGSRLVVVLRIYKQPDAQLNYGTGRDVSDESIADAREPLAIRWYATSYVDVPVRK